MGMRSEIINCNFDAGFIRAWQLVYEVDFALCLRHRGALNSLRFPGGIRGQLQLVGPNPDT